MRIDRIKIQGFTTFKSEAVLDLAALGPGLIAIAGPNGAGKSTLLEAIPGGIYRQAPSRGNVADLATARDAQIELAGENGSPFVARLDVDAHTGKSEAVLLDGAGNPLGGPKVREYDRAVSEKFPPLPVFLAASFACQTGAGSLLRMDRAERRALFGRLLGLDHLEDLAGSARERARRAEQDLAEIRAAAVAIQDGAGNLRALEESLDDARIRAGRSAEDLARVRERAGALAAERDRLKAARAEAQRAEKAVQEARQRVDRLEQEADTVRRDLAALSAILDEAGAIKRNAAEISAREAGLEQIRARGERAAEDERRLVDIAQKADLEAIKAEQIHRDIIQTETRARERLADARRRLEQAEKSTAAVPCAGAVSDEIRAGCAALVGHFRIRDEARRTIADIEAGPDLRAAIQDALATLDAAKDAAEAAARAAAKAKASAELVRAEYRNASSNLATFKAKDKSAQLARAEAEAGALNARLQSVLDQAHEAATAADRLAAECPKVDGEKVLQADDAALQAEREVRDVAAADQEIQRAVAKLETQLESAKAAEAKAAELKAKIVPLERDLTGWRFLARGLGREGVQALELDAAGPQVSALANELLADAYGPRFQIRFETQAAKADGKGVKETFDIIVVDNERGREGNGDDLSGGEKVIVGEALGLAVGLFHSQSAGVSLGTVVRDETVGALDPDNAERYLAMLRAFIRVGRVHQLLFVAHQPALVDLADAVVHVDNGRIEVRG